jgi:EAL domain-containing protein (putative c-di-GMP-specific phosphodiesterase class I)/GGDEF domain-containing protein
MALIPAISISNVMQPYSTSIPRNVALRQLDRRPVDSDERAASQALAAYARSVNFESFLAARLMALPKKEAPNQIINAFSSIAGNSHRAYLKALAGFTSWQFDPDWLADLLSHWRHAAIDGISLDDGLASVWIIIGAMHERLFAHEENESGVAASMVAAVHHLGQILVASLAEIADSVTMIRNRNSGRLNMAGLMECLTTILERVPATSTSLIWIRLAGLSQGSIGVAQRRRAADIVLGRVALAIRVEDLLIHVSDDVVAVVLPRLGSMAQARLAANKLATILAQPLRVEGVPIHVRATLGCASAPEDGGDPNAIIDAARRAEAVAKQTGLRQLFHSAEMTGRSRADLELEMQVVKAFENNEFVLYLQPQLDLPRRRCVGAESLLRWQGNRAPRGGPYGEHIPPTELLKVLHRAGYAQDFTQWLIKTVCRLANELAQQDIDIPLSLNVLAEDLIDSELPELVAQQLAFWRISGQRLMLEITEGTPISKAAVVDDVIGRLHELEVGISIDEFGTGYSSLWQLRRFPVKEIKIDRSFVERLGEVTNKPTVDQSCDIAVVRSMVDLAHTLGMSVTAVGVASAVTFKTLQKLRCDRVQGLLVSPPLPVADFVTWYCANERLGNAKSRS